MCCLSWLHLVAQVEMQGLWNKIPVMSSEGVAKQEVTSRSDAMHWLKLQSTLYLYNPLLYWGFVFNVYFWIAINASSS